MNNSDVQQQINVILTNSFTREFWLNLQDELQASYTSAHTLVEGNLARIENAEKVRLRPQLRHYLLNAAFRRAAVNSGHECIDAVTTPKGENYVVVQSQGIKISRIGLNHDQSTLRTAKHRTLIAELNNEFEGYTPDLFQSEQSDNIVSRQDTLGVLAINVNPPASFSQDSMLDIRITVPFTNLKGFHYNQSIREILGLYNVANNVIDIPDLAIPLLKKRLKEQEK